MKNFLRTSAICNMALFLCVYSLSLSAQANDDAGIIMTTGAETAYILAAVILSYFIFVDRLRELSGR
ncbi:hypothetical protein BH10PAT3_BH10PAT3_7070 [soil metagenome]